MKIKCISASIGCRKFDISIADVCALEAGLSYVTVFYMDNGQCKQVDILESVRSLIPKLPNRFLLTRVGTLIDRRRVTEYVYCKNKQTASIRLQGVDHVFRVSRRNQAIARKTMKRCGVTIL